MSELIVKISDSGAVRLFVDDHQVGLVQELTVRASTDRPVPAVEIRFPSSSTMAQSSEGLQESLRSYLELLRKIPSVVLMSGDEPTGTDSRIILYFLDQAVDGGGRTLTQAMQKDNSWFERTHDCIQWMLPTKRESKYEPAEPVLSDRDIQVFQVRRDIREAYSFGVDRVKRFLELDQMRPVWVRKKDHNHKRITRLLESLMDLGFEERARRVLEQVLRIERANPDTIDPEAVEHWKGACAR
jgi:Opioid growth factor receptor (OGFr) conserved region